MDLQNLKKKCRSSSRRLNDFFLCWKPAVTDLRWIAPFELGDHWIVMKNYNPIREVIDSGKRENEENEEELLTIDQTTINK